MIGVFDSGFGGLSIFHKIEEFFPGRNLLYLGDSRRVPYGNRSAQTVIDWTRESVEYLKGRGCSVVILACHTASNVALPVLEDEFSQEGFHLLGVTRPIVEAVCEVAKKRVGVLATRSTIQSEGFLREVLRVRPELEVVQKAAPMLVPLVEEGYSHSPECKRFIRRYLGPLKQARIDTLLLGCTHYPLIHDLFDAKSGSSIQVPDTAHAVASKLRDYCDRYAIETQAGETRILTTDDPRLFEQIGSRFLGRKFEALQVGLRPVQKPSSC